MAYFVLQCSNKGLNITMSTVKYIKRCTLYYDVVIKLHFTTNLFSAIVFLCSFILDVIMYQVVRVAL